MIFTGERGELVLTTLKKRARPMIRFRTGDIVSFNPEPCRCGRTVIRLNGVHGRLDDMLIIKGVNLFPSDVEAVARQDHDLTGEGGRARRPARPAHQTRTLRIAFCANCRQSPASPRK